MHILHRLMKFKHTYLFISFFQLINLGYSQQDPQYSQYMFNQLVINPAYSGSRNALNILTDLRQQWVAMPGAPQTGCLSAHGPLPSLNMGVGGHLVYEKIGPANWAAAYTDIAYRLKLGPGKLAIGVSAGAVNYNLRTNELVFKSPGEVLPNQYPGAKTVFDAGAGVYYNSRLFFFGASATHLNAPVLFNETSPDTALVASKTFFNLQPHIFVFTGRAFEINENVVLSPSVMAKMIQTAPSSPSVDINCNVFLKKCLWVGVSYRLSYGITGLMQYYVNDNFRIGYAYDLGINKIGTYGQSTHEIMLSYDFRIYKQKTQSPRQLFM